MKTKYLIVFVVIALLIIESHCQRGGGRRSFSRRRRGGRSSFPLFGSRSSKGNSTCIIKFLIQTFLINNSTTQTSQDFYQNETPQGFALSSTTLIILALGLILFCVNICRKGQFRFRLNKDQQIKRILDQFARDNECQGRLNESLVNETFNWFVSTKWKVQIRIGFHAKIQLWDLKLNKLTKKQELVYDIEAEGCNEAYGSFNLKGVLMLRNRSVNICLIKQITQRTPHIIKGKLGLVIYRAHSDDCKIQGKWNYYGFRYDPRYSGFMRMVPQSQ